MIRKSLNIAAGVSALAVLMSLFLYLNLPRDDLSLAETDISPVAGGTVSEVSLKETTKSGGNLSDQEISLIDSATLKEFKYLQHNFRKSRTHEEHLDDVKAFLFNTYDEGYAALVFRVYSSWLACEMDVVKEFRQNRTNSSLEEMTDILDAIHEFRIQQLGEELAERLFRQAYEQSVYSVSRASIISSSELYGEEKEALLSQLDGSFEGVAATITDPYTLYREKLVVYSRDLSEADSDEQRKDILDTLRNTTLPQETIGRLQGIDRAVNENSLRDGRYQEGLDLINSDTALSGSERKQQIDELQLEVYGINGAAAKKRMESIEDGYQRIVSGLGEQN